MERDRGPEADRQGPQGGLNWPFAHPVEPRQVDRWELIEKQYSHLKNQDGTWK